MNSATLQPATPTQHHRFHFLDALRGIAAVLVILRHAPSLFSHGLVSGTSWLAVDFFFCLSGFVIAFSYEGRLRSHLTLTGFTVARTIRLYPLAVLGTLSGLVAVLLTRLVTPAAAPLHLPSLLLEGLLGVLLLPDLSFRYNRASIFPLDGVMYTLFFELLANLVYAALTRARAATNPVVLLTFLISAALLTTDRLLFRSFDLGFTTLSLPIGLLRVGLSFSAGVLVYRSFFRAPRIRLTGNHATLAAFAVFAIFVAALSNAFSFLGPAAAELLTVSVLFPTLVFVGAWVALPSAWNPLCSFLGNISYPLYILHVPLLWPFTLDRSNRFAELHPVAANVLLLADLPLLIGIAWIAATLYDAPVRARLTRMYRNYQASRSFELGTAASLPADS